ncbi:Ureohydrolase [Terfezia boudieri ATCC MYA-4762]|uniref:Ureohydrolase n=1 Tax=Terfezia boudieri ATCC MYA-4762 TaxID=1051890 RepID=A0A3N4LNL3_9PEZI|nr:Ureohydrolase [Terfezia boudieri ATCC MYA-4762]
MLFAEKVPSPTIQPTPISSHVIPSYLPSGNQLGLVSVGFSGGQRKPGVEVATDFLVKAGLLDDLRETLGYTLQYDNTIHTYADDLPKEDPPQLNLRNPLSVSVATKKLSSQVYSHAKEGRLTLTLGGDHSIAIGSISGAARAIRERLNRSLNVIWDLMHAGSAIEAKRLVYIGLRIGRCVELALEHLAGLDRPDIKGVKDSKGLGPTYLSFDVDALDPMWAPSTGTPVRGGLTLREGDFICECVHATGALVGMDLMEVNPIAPGYTAESPGAEATIRAGCSLIRCALGESLL